MSAEVELCIQERKASTKVRSKDVMIDKINKVSTDVFPEEVTITTNGYVSIHFASLFKTSKRNLSMLFQYGMKYDGFQKYHGIEIIKLALRW